MLVMIIAVAIILLIASQYKKSFRENHKMTVGQIFASKKGYGSRGNFGVDIQYKYFVNGHVQYASTRDRNLRFNTGQFMIGKYFPVLYKKTLFGYDETILITPSEFKSYGYAFPDSLRWIIKYIEN
ncbi:MAG: hypothetical protein BGO70_08955 [Bacteroidetes bacterium 43-93]|nr:MAG: hypothetical protein BGO70_08955 [Bacteroidetes bacterium 43-93]